MALTTVLGWGVRTWTTLVVVGSISLYLVASISSHAINLHFDDNCRPPQAAQIPHWGCIVGNVAGWLSGSLWFACVLSQIVKDAMVTKCLGLSVVWAWLNFTASSLNAFAVFAWHLPLFTRVTSVYMPVLNGCVLLQLLYFRNGPLTARHAHHGDLKFSWTHWAMCLTGWSVLMAVGIGMGRHPDQRQSMADGFSLIAIGMWSVEGLFQLAVNLRRGTCDGQSYAALALTAVGKSSDIITQWLLLMPSRYLVLAYCSSACGFLNVLQALYYEDHIRSKWHGIPATLLGLYLVWMLAGFMTYLIVFAPFPGEPSDWIRNTRIRWYLIPGPLVIAALALFGYRTRVRRVEYQSMQLAADPSHCQLMATSSTNSKQSPTDERSAKRQLVLV